MAIVCGLVVAWRQLDEWAWSAVARSLAAAGLRAEVERFHLRPQRFSLEFTNLRVWRVDPSTGRFEASVSYGKLAVPWRYVLGLGRRRVHLAELTLVRPSVVTDGRLLDRSSVRPTASRSFELDVFVDRLQIVGGRWTHEQQDRPLDLRVDDVEIEGGWTRGARSVLGQIGLRAALATPPLEREVELNLASQFRWRRTTIELIDARITGPGVRLHADATFDLDEQPLLTGTGVIDADLAAVGGLLSGLPRIDGRVEGSVEFTGPDPPKIRGRLQLSDGALDRLAIERAEFALDLEQGALRFREIDARAYGGAVRGSVDAVLGDPASVRVDLEASALDGRRLARLLDVELPLASAVDARLRLAGRPEDRRSWDGTATFSATGRRAGPGEIPFDADGTVTIADGSLTVASKTARTIGTRASLRLEAELERTPPSGRLEISGTTDDGALTQTATILLLDAIGIDYPEIVRKPISGRGTFEAVVDFGAKTDLSLGLDLRDGMLEDRPYDLLDLALRIDAEDLAIDHAELSGPGLSIEGSARVGLAPLRLEEIRLVGERIELADLLDLLDLSIDVGGRLSGNVTALQGEAGLDGSGELMLVEANAFGQPIERVTATLRIVGDRFLLEPFDLLSPAGTVSGRGELDQSSRTARFDIDSVEVALERLPGLDGAVEARVVGVGSIEVGQQFVAGQFEIEGQELRTLGIGLGDFSGTLTLDQAGVEARLSSIDARQWGLEAALGWGPGSSIEAVARLDQAVVELPTEAQPAPSAELSGRFAIRGPLTRAPELVIDGAFDHARLHFGPHALDLAGSAPVRISDGRLQIGPLRLTGEATDLEVESGYDFDGGSIATSIGGTVGIELLSSVLPDVRASGSARIDLRIDGPAGSPTYSGSLALRGGRLRYLGFPHTLEQIEATATFRDQTATIERVRALLGGGELEGRGALRVGASGVESMRFDVSGSNVRVALPAGFVGVYDGELVLEGTLEQPRLSGDVTMLRGIYNEEFRVGGVFGGGSREYAPTEMGGPLAEMVLDLLVHADGNVWVRNDVAELESFFDLRIGGTPRRPEIIGRLGLVEGGTLQVRDITYRIRSGTLDFTDIERINPYIQVAAWTAIGGYEITLRVEGTLDALRYDLTSTPSLSQPDIVALLTTGKTLQELAPDGRQTDAEFSGDLAASYFAGALTGRFENQLQQALGLDVLAINPLLIEAGDPTTRVTVGKKVSDDVTAILSADLRSTEDRLYQVEWRANPRMLVTVQRDINGGVGSNVLYTDRFWWRVPRGETVKAVPAEIGQAAEPEPAGRTVGRLTIVGVDEAEAAELVRLLPVEPGAAYSRAEVFRGVERIRSHYVRRGRIKVRVDATTSPEDDPSQPVELVYQVDPGPQIELEFRGLKPKEQRRLTTQLETMWTESLFADDLYTDAVVRIREDLQQRGFYAVDVRHELHDTGAGETVIFEVDRGELVKVAGITLHGTSAMTAERVRKQMLTRPPSLFGGGVFKPATLREDLAAIRNLYLDQGYLDVEIDAPRLRLSTDGRRIDISIAIHEGPRQAVVAIRFEGETGVDDKRLEAWSGIRIDEPFSGSALLGGEASLRREFDRLGHPGARVSARLERSDRGVEIVFEIEPGPKVVAAEVRVSGNQLTNERLIRRELAIKQGELVTRDKLLRSQQSLYRLGVFRNVRIEYREAHEIGPGYYVVEVRVEEDRPLTLATGVGYNTEAKFKFSFASAHNNVQGKARSLGVQGEVSSILSRVQLIGRTPRLFGAAVPGLGNILWEREQKDGFSIERRSTALRVERILSQRWRGFLRYNFQNVMLLEVTDPAEVAEERVEDIILGDVAIGLLRSTLDNLILPTRGNYFNVNFAVFAEPFLSEADFVLAALTETHTWSYSNGTTFVTTFRVGVAPPFGRTDLVPVSERFFAGGDSTNRGFERDRLGPTAGEISASEGTPLPAGVAADQPVGGEAQLLFNQEFRFPLLRKLRLKGVLFYDAGNVYFRVSDFDPTDLRHTLGSGLRLETPVGPIRMEYGWKLDRRADESSGVFHLAIGAVF
ncbi:MAG TPA: outer membrane protein assembly factor BamA [Candidatus Polarisedimenticolaceae bacterium]|nr:outer membrane protein assembly factor BamA [Candidatus Polarisedimenticolaceae bacterium]